MLHFLKEGCFNKPIYSKMKFAIIIAFFALIASVAAFGECVNSDYFHAISNFHNFNIFMLQPRNRRRCFHAQHSSTWPRQCQRRCTLLIHFPTFSVFLMTTLQRFSRRNGLPCLSRMTSLRVILFLLRSMASLFWLQLIWTERSLLSQTVALTWELLLRMEGKSLAGYTCMDRDWENLFGHYFRLGEGSTIVCPLHKSAFSLETGEGRHMIFLFSIFPTFHNNCWNALLREINL